MEKEEYHVHAKYCLSMSTYFMLISVIGALLLWVPKSFSKPMPFIDALYNAVSAGTVTGLVATFSKGETAFDGLVLTTLMILGSQILTSLALLYVRRYMLWCRIKEIDPQFLAPNHSLLEDPQDAGSAPTHNEVLTQERQARFKFFFKKILGIDNAPNEEIFHDRNEEMYHESRRSLSLTEPVQSLYLEHDAVVLLTRVVLAYIIGVQVLGFVVTQILVLLSPHARHVLEQNGVNLVLFAWVAAVSMFNNSGYSVVNENIMAVRTSSFLMLWLGFMILMGNTMFAPCLRGIIWILYRFSKNKNRVAYEYLLHHPKNFYAHLFPRTETIWLMITILGLNGFQIFTFLLSEWNGAALEGVKSKDKFIIAIYQSISTRNAGVGIVNFWQLSPAMLVVFAVMMYIAVYPVFLLRRKTRMRAKDWKRGTYKQILRQSRKLLARESAYLVIVLFLLCLLERKKIVHDGLNFSIFNVIFEVASGYGNSGLSVGYSCQLSTSRPCTDVPFSLSGLFSVPGKMLIIIVMFLGRHRGLWDIIIAATALPESYHSTYIPNMANRIEEDMHNKDSKDIHRGH